MTVFVVAIAAGDSLKYLFVYGSFVWEIQARYDKEKYNPSLPFGLNKSVCFLKPSMCFIRTSDSGNVNHSVSLPIILIKIKVDQMLPSSYISSLLVSIL